MPDPDTFAGPGWGVPAEGREVRYPREALDGDSRTAGSVDTEIEHRPPAVPGAVVSHLTDVHALLP